MLASTKPKGGESHAHDQSKPPPASLARRRVLAALLAMAAAPAMADDPVPDKTGAFQTTPTAYSVPGYTKPDPAKATTKDLAVAVDAVAQSASHGIYSVNFVWTLVAGFLVMFMQAGFALVETGLIRAKNAAHTMSMNFMVYAPGHARVLHLRLRLHVRRPQRHRHRRPGIAGRRSDAALDAHRRRRRQRRSRLGPPRHHRVLPHRQRLRRRRDRAVPVHDGLHGHDGDHRHRRLRRALELQELLHLQHLRRRLHLPGLRLLGVGRRLAGAARLPRRASATARSTTPAPASSTCRVARWRSSPRS